MDLKIDPETMRALVQKTVLDTLTPETREQILVTAIASLFQTGSGYSKQSTLEELFAQEARAVAKEAIRAELAKPENQQRIADMVVASWTKVMTDPEKHDKAITRMADALTDALVTKEYR